MNVKGIFKILIIASFLMSTYGVASAGYTYMVSTAAIQNMNDWTEMGGMYSQTVSGTDQWSYMRTNSHGDGVWASVKVTGAYCPSYCMVRLARDVGYYNGKLLRAEVRLGKGADDHTIQYRIREMDSAGNYVGEIARGYLGASTGQQWAVGETINLAAAVEGSEFIFFADNQGLLSKVQLLGLFTPLEPADPWQILIWTESASDSMTATASGFMAVDVFE